MDEAAQQEHVPLDLVEECLFDHFVLAHNVSPDELLDLKKNIKPREWANFLVRSHFILHMIEKHGEYHDDQFHFNAGDLT